MAAEDPRPRCIVLPLPSQAGAQAGAVGMAVHFLLGNVVVLHPGFREFWFGWRVSKVFPSPGDLTGYCRNGEPVPDPVVLGRREKIRYWIGGSLDRENDRLSARLHLTDAEQENHLRADAMALDAEGHLVGFRRQFIQWMDRCGLPFAPGQAAKALWPEKAGLSGLSAIGYAVEAFYLESGYEKGTTVDLKPFVAAVSAAPEAFMGHDLLGWALYRNNRFAEARESFLRAVGINAQGAGAMAGLMWCGVKTLDREEALYWAARKAEACAGSIEAAKEKALRLLTKQAKSP